MGRSGDFYKHPATVEHPQGYLCFAPSPLPPEPALVLGDKLMRLLSAADQSLGRLSGATSILPNPDLFVGMYVKQEAVLSSEIEGTQASLLDVLKFEAGDEGRTGGLSDVKEVVNYVDAMNHGLARLSALPLSLRLITEIHERLLQGVRGNEKQPGRFRMRQNWIGPGGSTIDTATFVPPAPETLPDLLGAFEKFLHDTRFPSLIQAGLAHAQFETIHPFEDGNGRIGRLLITFLLCEQRVLERPLLYLSVYLKQHRAEYYDRLQAVRTDGAWEPWLEFFLRGVQQVADDAHRTAQKILALREDMRSLLATARRSSALGRAIDILFKQPIVTVQTLAKALDVTDAGANNFAAELVKLKVLEEITGQKRNRRFAFSAYLDLFVTPTLPEPRLEAESPTAFTAIG